MRARSSVQRDNPFPQPRRGASLAEVASRQGQPGRDVLLVVDRQPIAVRQQEVRAGRERGAFVAVHERVVLGKAEGVGGREVGNVGVTVGPQVVRPCQGALQEALVSDTGRAAVFGALPRVGGQHLALGQPARFGHALPGQDGEDGAVLAHGVVERLGEGQAELYTRDAEQEQLAEGGMSVSEGKAAR